MVASRLYWQETARPNQIPPDDYSWIIWLILSGRGWGKTRTGAEWIVHKALSQPKTRWAVVAATSNDVRETCFEGVSGIISVLQRYGIYQDEAYNRTYSSYTLPNGSRIKGFTAEKPDRLRGPQHHGAWCDELAAWEKPDAFDQLMFGLRLGQHPQTVITTTPRPIPILKTILKREATLVTKGSMYENKDNLAPSMLTELQLRYGGTRLGRQELEGELLEDMEGALWTREWIEQTRIRIADMPPLYRIVVAIDPAVTSGENSDETGIVVAGATVDGHFYVLQDSTLRGTPNEWGLAAVSAFNDWKADRIVAEVNNGGDMVPMVIRSILPTAPVTTVHATRGKRVRAEPISALYEQKRVHHVGAFPTLEDQMVTWTPESNESPDRLDALVWALTELKEGSSSLAGLAAMASICSSCQMPNIKTANVCAYCKEPMNGA